MSLPAQGAGYEANPADVQAYDVRTGKVRWVFHTIPLPGEFGYDTWPDGAFKTAGGVHNWSELTVDEAERHRVHPDRHRRASTSTAATATARISSPTASSRSMRSTGKRLWHQQLVHHDLWDFDLPQAPKLLTLRQNGRTIDAVAQATKMGFVFVFERKTGKPVFPIEERPVPQSDVPGEVSWPTQPFPTKPAPFARQSFTEKDINPFLPPAEHEAMRQTCCNVAQRRAVHAAEPRGIDLDARAQRRRQLGQRRRGPDRGEMYVVAKNMPVMLRLVRSNEEPTAGGALGRRTAEPDHHARRRRRS